MTKESDTRKYRFLFYLAVAFGLAASGIACYAQWILHQQRLFYGIPFGVKRDQKFEFIINAYGYKYQGETDNLVDEEVLYFGVYEKHLLFFMRDYLRNLAIKDAVVIDVGANTGNHSLFLSRYAAQVHAFEPYPPVIRKLRANLELNPTIRNIELHEVGLGDQDAELPFLQPSEDNLGIGTFRADGKETENRAVYPQKLKIVVGDQWLQPKITGPIVLVKIDVEGFEEAVLTGLRQTLTRFRPLVVVEVTRPPNGTIDSLPKLAALFPENYDLLASARTWEGSLRGQYSLQPLVGQSLPAIVDVVAYPRERAAAVLR